MKKSIFLSLVVLLSCATQLKSEKDFPHPLSESLHSQYEKSGSRFAISAQGVATSKAAESIFQKGGNIIDALVAASFAVSVERPHSTGIGGGGFLLFRQASTGKVFAIDFRERAPQKAREKMYLNAKGEEIPNLTTRGGLSVGVPGLVAGLLEIHGKWGKLPLKDVMEPAIKLADSGFPVYPALETAMASEAETLKIFPESKKIFITNEKTLKAGENLIQKDLAKTLKLISEKGRLAFYGGDIAKAIVRSVKTHGGIISLSDLSNYKVKWRTPLKSNYKSWTMYGMPPPSSGGIHVFEILNILERDSLKASGVLSPQAVHLMASSMQMAFADRAKFLGDPDFVKVPVAGLISQNYADVLRAKIPPESYRASRDVSAGKPAADEHPETTHISIIDHEGNMVSSTQSINGWMGSGLIADETGILLNNTMDDFSTKPGASNMFGAVGSQANSIAPGKTPLSSMSPTLILDSNLQPVLSIGAPGGTRIITCVTQVILNYLEFGLPLYDSVALRRFHHQWLPERLEVEPPGFSSETTTTLKKWNYPITSKEIGCRVMAVSKEGDQLHGVSDPRDYGAVAAQ